MATICTNFLTGNDTTGDGSPSLPYKTINKALSVAINNDLIKVAGSDFSKLSGTITCSARATTMTTSVDLRGSLSVGDVISIDTFAVDGWNKEHTLFTVTAINATTITMGNQPVMFKAGTYDIYKFNTFHYSTTSTTPQETISSYAATTLTVSGGWSSDFETQIGWTGVRRSDTTGGIFMTYVSLLKGGVIFDKFLFSQSSMTNGNSSQLGVDTVNFVNTNDTFGTSNFGVWSPTSKGFTTIIGNACAGVNSSWNAAGNRPPNFTMKQYITGNLSSGQIKVGFSLFYGKQTECTRSSELYVRSSGTQATSISTNNIFPTNSGDIVIDNLYIYVYDNGIIPIYEKLDNYAAYRYINNIEVFTDETRAGIVMNRIVGENVSAVPTPFTLNKTSGTLESLPWRLPLNSPSYQSVLTRGYMTTANGRDTEGNKVMTSDGMVKYADTSTFVSGSNSLRQKIFNATNTGSINRLLLGSIQKPSTSFTLNITMKANRTLPTAGNSLVLMFTQGTEVTETIITLASSVSITSSFQTFSYSINPASYPYWNSLNFTNLMSVFFVIPASSTALTDNDFIWIDSITIS